MIQRGGERVKSFKEMERQREREREMREIVRLSTASIIDVECYIQRDRVVKGNE